MRYANMVLFLSAAFMAAALVTQASALSIGVQVEKNFSGEMKEIERTYSNGLGKFSFEFFNSGSLPYGAIARADIMENGKPVCTSWSDYKSLNPGDRAFFSVFCRSDHTGSFVPRIRVYYANEIMEKYYGEEYMAVSGSSGTFKISNVVSGNNYIAFDIVSSESANVAITSESYLPGWIFHQITPHLEANASSRQKIYYDADVVMNNDAVIYVSSTDGSSFASQQIKISTEESALGKFIDRILAFFSSVLKA